MLCRYWSLFKKNHFISGSGQRNADDGLSLAQAKFTIGDYMDINITPPNRVPQQRRRPY